MPRKLGDKKKLAASQATTLEEQINAAKTVADLKAVLLRMAGAGG